jgi:uncharacterized protein YlxW (UPF0749 family)
MMSPASDNRDMNVRNTARVDSLYENVETLREDIETIRRTLDNASKIKRSDIIAIIVAAVAVTGLISGAWTLAMRPEDLLIHKLEEQQSRTEVQLSNLLQQVATVNASLDSFTRSYLSELQSQVARVSKIEERITSMEVIVNAQRLRMEETDLPRRKR